jgi:hypothetical protein
MGLVRTHLKNYDPCLPATIAPEGLPVRIARTCLGAQSCSLEPIRGHLMKGPNLARLRPKLEGYKPHRTGHSGNAGNLGS